MLKSVCRVCYERHGMGWLPDDDVEWDKRHGLKLCPACAKPDSDLETRFKTQALHWSYEQNPIYLNPPPGCEYVLEHQVLGQTP